MENMEMKDLIESAAHNVNRNFCNVDQVDATESYIFAVLQCRGEFIVNNNFACCRFCRLHSAAHAQMSVKSIYPLKSSNYTANIS